MADVNDGDILRIGCGLSFQGVYDVANIYHVLVETLAGMTWASADSLIQLWAENVYEHIKAILNDDIGTHVISVANVTEATTLGAIAWDPTWAGTEGGEPTAPGVCCFGWARTYKPRVQIRKYIGVLGEANMAAGVWNAAVQTAVGLMMDEIMGRMNMGGNTYFTGVAYNVAAATYERGVSTDVSAEPAYQRRRKRGRGS